MALVVHQTSIYDKCYSASTVYDQQRSRVVELRCFVHFQLLGRPHRVATLKHRFLHRGQSIIFLKEKSLKVYSFKSNGQHDGADGKDRESKFSKIPVQFSHVPPEREEGVLTSADVTSNSVSCAPGNREKCVSESQSVERLFKKWLMMLLSQRSSKEMDDVRGNKVVESEICKNQVDVRVKNVVTVLMDALVQFMGLDATIKIPLLIFIPWYIVTRLTCGIEVTKELTPLWVLGPLITALYVKIFQGICFLYVFCFKQVVRFLENAPRYSPVIYSYVTKGKLKAFLYARLCQPVIDIKNMDYKALLRAKLKQLKEWIVERYLDYVESIWPYYCRTIRFLKKANLL